MQVSKSSLRTLESRRARGGFSGCVRSLFRMQYIRYRSNEPGHHDPQIEGSDFTGILEDPVAAVLILSSIRKLTKI